MPLVRRLDAAERRILLPGIPGRPGLGHLGEPQLQPLVRRVGGEQAVQRGRAGPGEPGDEDRPLDGDPCVFGVARPSRLADQPGDQRATQEGPEHPRAEFRQAGVAGAGVEQHSEAVAVVAGAEVGQSGDLGGRGVQVFGRADLITPVSHRSPPGPCGPRGTTCGPRSVLARGTTPESAGQCWPGGTTPRNPPAQWWYSPPSTPRHWPVMARAIGEARNTTASATSSGSGSRRRSIVAAVSS